MAAESSWSLRGVDPRAREVARSAAKREGITIGEWLNRQLLDDGAEPGETSDGAYEDPEALAHVLDRLSRRIEAAEHRSTLAITGIDQSVLGVISRLQSAEDLQTEFSKRYDAALTQLRETQTALHDRIGHMEREGRDAGSLEALKSLEDALAKVANQVYDSEADTKARIAALKSDIERAAKRSDSRVDALNRDLDERMAAVERRVDTDLSDVTDTVAREVGIAAKKLGRDIEAVARRTEKVEKDVRFVRDEIARTKDEIDEMVSERAEAGRQQIETLEDAVTAINARLGSAEKVTDDAIKALEASFAQLDGRVKATETRLENLGPVADRDAFAAEVETRFEALSKELSEMVTTTRSDIAGKMVEVAADPNVATLGKRLNAVVKQINAAEKRQHSVLERISGEVAKLAGAVETRVRQSEEQMQTRLAEAGDAIADAVQTSQGAGEDLAAARERIGSLSDGLGAANDKIDALAAKLETATTADAAGAAADIADELEAIQKRVADAEESSARAVGEVAKRVDLLGERFNARRDEFGEELSRRIRESEDRTRAAIDNTLGDVNKRLDDSDDQTASVLSPVQRALDALRTRLEALEGGATETGARPAAPTDDIAPPPFETDFETLDPAGEGLTDFAAAFDLTEPVEGDDGAEALADIELDLELDSALDGDAIDFETLDIPTEDAEAAPEADLEADVEAEEPVSEDAAAPEADEVAADGGFVPELDEALRRMEEAVGAIEGEAATDDADEDGDVDDLMLLDDSDITFDLDVDGADEEAGDHETSDEADASFDDSEFTFETDDGADASDALETPDALDAADARDDESDLAADEDEGPDYSLAFGKALDDADRPAPPTFDGLGADDGFDPFADDKPNVQPPEDFLRAAREAARANGAPDRAETPQPGFGPAAEPAKTKKSRGLLYAVSGLAFLAVGAAGVLVLSDAGRRSATNDIMSGPLDGMVADGATDTATDAQTDVGDAAASAPEPAFTADPQSETLFPVDMSRASGPDFSLFTDAGALFSPIRPEASELSPETGDALAAALAAARGAEPTVTAPPVAPSPREAEETAANVEAGVDATAEPTPETEAALPASVEDALNEAEAETSGAATPEADVEEASAEAADDTGGDAEAAIVSDTPLIADPEPTADAVAPVETATTLESAAASGDPIAQYELGVARLDAGDAAEGVRLLIQSAENGLAPAQYRLGKLYETGSGVSLDLGEARRWTERAANAGHVKAMHNLGIFYAEGRGAEQNFEDAARWFEEASLLGSADSQYNLAVLYEQGLGVPLSLPDAYAWFSITARSGDEDAGRRAEAIGERLDPQARERADEAVRRFSPRPLDDAANGVFRNTPWGSVDLDVRASIARAQAALARLGYAPGPADGAVGPMTVAAIRAYQVDSGLEATGEVDAALLELLEADVNAL